MPGRPVSRYLTSVRDMPKPEWKSPLPTSMLPGSAKAVPFTLADLAFAAVANSYAQVTLSLSANINFLKAVSAGWLYAEAREIHHHPRIPYIEVRICQEDGDLVAILNSTGYRKKDRLPIDHPSDTEQS